MSKLTPTPGSYITDSTGKLLVSGQDLVDRDDPLVAKNRGKWMTPAPKAKPEQAKAAPAKPAADTSAKRDISPDANQAPKTAKSS